MTNKFPEPTCTKRASIHQGMPVDIVLKADQPTGKLTRGVVKRILTNSPTHPRGIKVMLEDGQVGRVHRNAASVEAASFSTLSQTAFVRSAADISPALILRPMSSADTAPQR